MRMNYIIEGYINNLSINDVKNFADNNYINLTNEELNFTYNFIKTNYKEVLRNPNSFNFNNYRNKFSEESFYKIEALIKKYSSYLN